MRFTMRPEAIERLGLSMELKDREFLGPSVEDGLLAGFTVGENKWARNQVKAKSSYDLDPMDARVFYHFLTVRRDDPTLLPVKAFTELSVGDFEVTPHAAVGVEDEGCSDCGKSFASVVHLTGDDPE